MCGLEFVLGAWICKWVKLIWKKHGPTRQEITELHCKGVHEHCSHSTKASQTKIKRGRPKKKKPLGPSAASPAALKRRGRPPGRKNSTAITDQKQFSSVESHQVLLSVASSESQVVGHVHDNTLFTTGRRPGRHYSNQFILSSYAKSGALQDQPLVLLVVTITLGLILAVGIVTRRPKRSGVLACRSLRANT